MESDTMLYLRRLSISTKGHTIDVSQAADNLSDALEQELDYYKRVKKIPYQINIMDEGEQD